jgi:opacity protein-like surface antigen
MEARMKRRSPAISVVIGMLLLAGPAAARPVTGSIGLTPGMGALAPTGVFGSDLKVSPGNFVAGLAEMGWTIGGSVDVFFSERFALGAGWSYNRFGMDTTQLYDADPGVSVDAHWKVMQYGAHAKYLVKVNPATHIFARGGVVFGGPKANITATSEDVSAEATLKADTAAGFEIGVGVMHFVADKFAMIGSFGYTQLLTSGKDLTIDEGGEEATFEFKLNTNWVSFRIGGMILLGAK